MDRVDHRHEVLVRNVIHNAVAAAGDPPPIGLEHVYMIFDVLLDIGGTTFDQRPSEVNVAIKCHTMPVTLLVVQEVDTRGVHRSNTTDPHVQKHLYGGDILPDVSQPFLHIRLIWPDDAFQIGFAIEASVIQELH